MIVRAAGTTPIGSGRGGRGDRPAVPGGDGHHCAIVVIAVEGGAASDEHELVAVLEDRRWTAIPAEAPSSAVAGAAAHSPAGPSAAVIVVDGVIFGAPAVAPGI